MTLLHELKFALRSLSRAKALSATVVLTLALGIGANASIFSVVSGVRLRPLVNRDEGRLIYIRQSALGIGTENTAFSVPEIIDLRGRLKSVTAPGEFSTITFTMVGVLGRYASRFSVRALDLTLDASMLWVGVGLALLAAVLLAFVPRLPNADASHGFALSSGGPRITGATSRRLRMFAVTQIAASFVLLAGAGMLLRTL